MNLAEILKEKRSTLSSSCVNTYTSVLKSLHAKVFGSTTPLSLDNFQQTEKILDALSDKTPETRKTTLSALVVLTNNNKYRQKMMEDIQEHIHNIEEQQKTQKQIENSISQDEIKALLKKLKKKADILFQKSTHNNRNYQEIQDELLTGVSHCDFGMHPNWGHTHFLSDVTFAQHFIKDILRATK